MASLLEPKEAKEVAAALTLAMTKTTDSETLRTLSKGLAAVAVRLEHKEAREAAATLTLAMSTTREEYALKSLALDLATVAVHLEPKEGAVMCAQAAATLTHAMSKTATDYELHGLSSSLAAVLIPESTDRRSQRFRSVAGAVGLGTSTASLPLALAVLAPALDPLPEPLPSETLVELLKHPLCVGPCRRCVLDALGTRYRRTFADQWDFVRFATDRKLGLDFTTPPRRLDAGR